MNTLHRGIGVAIATRRLVLLATLVWPVGSEGQTELKGTWRGDLTTPVGALTLVLSLDGGSGGTIGVPARNISDIPVTDVTLGEDAAVSFRVPADQAAFEGRLENGSAIAGEWIQAGQRIPIEFERVSDAGEPPPARGRPQTPLPPFPYAVEEIVVHADERRLIPLRNLAPNHFAGFPVHADQG